MFCLILLEVSILLNQRPKTIQIYSFPDQKSESFHVFNCRSRVWINLKLAGIQILIFQIVREFLMMLNMTKLKENMHIYNTFIFSLMIWS